MLYVSLLHYRCERSLSARIGPSLDCNAGGEKGLASIERGYGTAVAISGALEKLP